MNPNEILRIVDAIHRDKNIDKEIVFQAIEAALVSATRRNLEHEAEVEIHINRQDGSITGTCDGQELDPEETVGRIGAQTAKQVIIQKIREAERDALYDEYSGQIGQMVTGIVQRNEGGAALVALGNVEAILPRSEQIPGETHHVNERVRATVFDVRKQGSRVKIILSRIRPQLVQRLFEQEIPEIAEGVIEVRAMAREPGYRSKVAVSSADQRVDCVGACVGVRGNRIRNIVDELHGERIDIVRWNDDMQVLIPNALQPATVDEVILCKMIGRAIVLVREDQLSLAIGRRGQNVRLASKLCGWDIEIMTQEELQEQIERAVAGFSSITGVSDTLAERLVGEGFLSYDDLSVIEPEDLMAMGDLTAEQVDQIVAEAEERAEQAEQAAAAERRRIKQEAAAAAALAEAGIEAAESEAAEPEAAESEAAEPGVEVAEPEAAASGVAEPGGAEEDLPASPETAEGASPEAGSVEAPPSEAPPSEPPGSGPEDALEPTAADEGDEPAEQESAPASQESNGAQAHDEAAADADLREASPHTNPSVERE